MSRKSRNAAVTFSLLTRLAVPFVVAAGGAAAQGCLFGSPGPSSVAVGKLYVSGDPSYDQFFSELFQVQLPLGRGTDREAANRARIADALGVARTSSAEQLGDALDQRALGFGKEGVTVKVQVAALEPPGKPSAELVVSGNSPKPETAALFAALRESLRDDAALIAELRQGRPRLGQLGPQADALEPGIDVTFRKGGAPKKAEVRKNVADAQRLIPLMVQRSDQLERLSTDLIRRVQKVLGSATATAPAPAPVAAPAEPAAVPPAPAAAKKPRPKAAHGDGEPRAAAPKPAAIPPAEKPEPKPEPKAKAPSDDFEP